MRLDYAILQSEEGRDKLARRALEILKSKSDDKTSYEAIADALHLATEQVLPNVLEQNRYGSLRVSCGSSRIDKSAEQCVRRLSYQTPIKTTTFLHCKVLAEHYNVLLERPNPTGFSRRRSCQCERRDLWSLGLQSCMGCYQDLETRPWTIKASSSSSHEAPRRYLRFLSRRKHRGVCTAFREALTVTQ